MLHATDRDDGSRLADDRAFGSQAGIFTSSGAEFYTNTRVVIEGWPSTWSR